jgi:hypothetical protein
MPLAQRATRVPDQAPTVVDEPGVILSGKLPEEVNRTLVILLPEHAKTFGDVVRAGIDVGPEPRRLRSVATTALRVSLI